MVFHKDQYLPLLFNVYTNDVPPHDLEAVCKYYRKGCIKANPLNSEISAFHSSNNFAHTELQVMISGEHIRYNPNRTSLGVTLDRSLTYRQHLTKIKSQNNTIHKLAGTIWGARAATLRNAAQALSYSVAEYCAPVCYKSHHKYRTNIQLNETMRIISGTL